MAIAGLNINKFVKGSSECKDYSIEAVDAVEVVDEKPKKKKKSTDETTSTSVVATSPKQEVIITPNDGLSFVQSNIPYIQAYRDTNSQLDSAINQLDYLGSEIISDLTTVKSSKTLKNKYNYINDMTATAANIINTKIGAIKEKNKVINDANNMEFKRIKELSINDNKEDDNQRIMNLYDAFINTPVGTGYTPGGMIGPSSIDMVVNGGMPAVQQMNIAPQSMDGAQQAWEQNLDPANNRMLLEAQGRIETVVMYDASTGNRWFDVIDKSTMQSLPNVEKPDNTFIYELDINTRGGFAKDPHTNVTYRLITLNNNDPSILEY